MHSCIYAGTVRHRRFAPVPHQFRYRLFQLYLDLQELPKLFDPYVGWSATSPAVAWFRRADHLGDPDIPLAECVREEVRRQSGIQVDGPVRLLTHLRYFGYVMNPVSYFYCFDAKDGRLQAVLAEVNNTPWGERYCYVIAQPIRARNLTTRSVWTPKAFHVSPFMKMDMSYRWRITLPGQRLAIHLQNFAGSSERGIDVRSDVPAAVSETPAKDASRDSFERDYGGRRQQPLLDVTLQLQRQEISRWNLARTLLQQPCMTIRVATAIYWQAFRLWGKGVPFVPHPRRRIDAADKSAGGGLSTIGKDMQPRV